MLCLLRAIRAGDIPDTHRVGSRHNRRFSVIPLGTRRITWPVASPGYCGERPRRVKWHLDPVPVRNPICLTRLDLPDRSLHVRARPILRVSGHRPQESRPAPPTWVPQRSVRRPRLSRRDRILWVWLSRLWTSWGFLMAQARDIVAVDFVLVPTLTFRLLFCLRRAPPRLPRTRPPRRHGSPPWNRPADHRGVPRTIQLLGSSSAIVMRSAAGSSHGESRGCGSTKSSPPPARPGRTHSWNE